MTITPDTIITAELLAGLDKCPFCGAEKQQENNQWSEFRCWTVIHINQLAVVSRSTRCVGCELITLRDRVKELEEALNQIANQDYRGNRSAESQIAYAALKKGTKP